MKNVYFYKLNTNLLETMIYNPEGSALRRDQLELLRMLQKIADICQKNDITWWLSSGTLLGAARHKGFIPWDDDLDIVLLRKDYQKLEKILCDLDSDEFVFHCMKTDPEYVFPYGKFRKREGKIQSKNRRNAYYKWTGIGLDIFSIEETNYFAVRTAKTLYNFQRLTSHIRCAKIRRPLIRLIKWVNFTLFHPVLRLFGQINPKKEFHYSLGTGWPKHTFFMNDTFPLSQSEFEGIMFPVPKDMDAYLTNVYGDWRRIPGEDQIRKAIHCQEYIDEIYGKQI